MSVAFGSVGAVDDGTTALDIAYPASISAGDLLLCFVGSKWDDSSHSVPSGFTLLDNDAAGFGNEFGSDSGTMVASVFTKIATGAESGTESVTVTNGGSAQGVIARVTRSAGTGFDIAATTGRWVTNDTNPISLSFDDDVGLLPGDYVMVFGALNANVATGIADPTIDGGGASFAATVATERVFNGSGTGGDCLIFLVDNTVNAGSSSGVQSFTGGKVSATNGEGPLILVRVREVTAAAESLPNIPNGGIRRMMPYFHY